MAHALFSPSAAHRWVQCPGSVVLNGPNEEQKSEAAVEGTLLHDVMFRHLKEGIPLNDMRNELSLEQLAACTACASRVKDIPHDVALYEVKVSFGEFVEQPEADASGTADVVLINSKEDVCHIVDYKFGRTYISSANNRQGHLYMLGVANTLAMAGFDFRTFRFEILQPFVGEEISNGIMELSAVELVDSAEEYKRACNMVRKAIKYYNGNDELWDITYLKPEENACRFCRGAGRCPALAKMAQREATVTMLDFLDNPDVIAERLNKLPMIESYCKELKKYAMNLALSGTPITGYKLVQGRAGNRAWENEIRVKDALHTYLSDDQMYSEPTLHSPINMQHALMAETGMSKSEAKDFIDGLCVRAEGKPTLVPVTAKGKEWNQEEQLLSEFGKTA